jgi:homocysteine S-methyltransferase
VRNVLAVTGDPPHVGDYPGRGALRGRLDRAGAAPVVPQPRRGLRRQGHDAPTSFFVGVAVNPSADDLDLELERFRREVDAGARFAMTQASSTSTCSTASPSDSAARAVGLAGVWPLGHAMALRLHNEVPGISVPGTVLDALQDAGADAPAVSSSSHEGCRRRSLTRRGST